MKNRILRLPEGAIDVLGSGLVLDVTISPDGDTLAVGGFKSLCFYDLPTMELISVLETPVRRLTYSHDGRWVATSNGNGCVNVWDVQRGTCISSMVLTVGRTVNGHRRVIHRLAFSPNSQYLAASIGRDFIVDVWNTETGEPVITLYDDTDIEFRYCSLVRPIVFSPDSHILACASPDVSVVEAERKADVISLWNMESGELISSLKGFPGFVYSFCFSPCGQFFVAGGRNGVVQVWDVASACLHREYSDFGNYAMSVSYSEEGLLRVAEISSSDSHIKVWDIESREIIYTYLEDKKFGFNTSHFSKGSRLVFASASEFNFWNAENSHLQTVKHLHTNPAYALAFSPNSDVLVGGYSDEGIMLWDMTRYAHVNVASKHYIESQTDSVPKKELSKQQPIVCKPSGYVDSISVTNTGKVYATSIEENTFNVWEIKFSEVTHQELEGNIQDPIHLQTGSEPVLTTSFISPTEPDKSVVSPDANLLICSDVEGTIYIWDMQRKEVLHTLVTDTGRINSLVLSPDSKKLMSISCVGPKAYLWDIVSGKKTPEFPRDHISLAAFSPNSSVIACVMRGEIMLWDMVTHDILLKFPRKPVTFGSLAYSPCGQYLVSGADMLRGGKSVGEMPVYLWEISSGKNVATFVGGHTRLIKCLAFSSDGTTLASSSIDGTIVLWDMKPYL